MAAQRKVKIHRADPAGFVPADAVGAIRKAVQSGTAELSIGRGQSLLAKAPRKRPGDHGHHVVLYRIESDDLPFLLDRSTGDFKPLEEVLNSLPELAQPTYYGLFDDGIVTFVYNHVGPKESQLASYLYWLDETKFDYTFPPVARNDILEAIAANQGVRLFNIRVLTDQLVRLSDISELAGMRAVAEGLPVGDVEIIVRARTDTQKSALGNVIQRIAPRLRSANHRGAIEKARIELAEIDGVTGDESLNLLLDKLVVTHTVDTVPGNRRYLDETSARNALEEAYVQVARL
ncbi:MAG TPA: hypothetical protein VFN61_11425 [Acidimicrobiales bacterium]|nr:hypothetical protein [Acidimicrobiales bacterium]